MVSDKNTKTDESIQKYKEQTAFFLGQGQINKSSMPFLVKRIENTVKHLIKQGIIYFGCGGTGLFDQLSGLAVLNARKDNPSIKLIMVLPCRSKESLFHGASTQSYKHLKENADKIIYTAERYAQGNLKKRDLHFINHSGVCVAYVKHINGDAGQILKLAKDNGLKIINLAEA